MVRHDLANVVTGISFYTSELEAELPDGTAAARVAAAIGDELARAAQLLDISRDALRYRMQKLG